MNPLTKSGLVLFCLALATSGCEDLDNKKASSNDQDTQNLALRADITRHGDGELRATAYVLSAEDPDLHIRLEKGDSLTLAADGQSNALQKDEDLLKIRYRGTLEQPVAAESTVTVALNRASEPDQSGAFFPTGDIEDPDFGEFFVSAPNSAVTLPPDFTLQSPGAATEFSGNDNITIQWSPTVGGQTMHIDSEASCATIEGGEASLERGWEVDDGDGSLTVAASDLAYNPDDQRCLIVLTLTRISEGTPDPKLSAASNILGKQRQTVSVVYIP